MTVIITPVGTSIFTNNPNIMTRFNIIRDKPESEWDNNSAYINRLEKGSNTFIRTEKTSASAELQSTDKIQTELRTDITVHLLASDTIASRLAAKILSGNVAGQSLGRNVSVKFNAQSDIISGLQVKNRRDFLKEGMNALIRRIEQINSTLIGDQSLAINITGGYGVTLPYLTIYAQLKGVRSTTTLRTLTNLSKFHRLR